MSIAEEEYERAKTGTVVGVHETVVTRRRTVLYEKQLRPALRPLCDGLSIVPREQILDRARRLPSFLDPLESELFPQR